MTTYLISAVSFQFIQFFIPSNEETPNHSQFFTETSKGQSGCTTAVTNLRVIIIVSQFHLFLSLKIKHKF